MTSEVECMLIFEKQESAEKILPTLSKDGFKRGLYGKAGYFFIGDEKMSWLDRTKMILGKQNMEKISNSRVAVLGLGGVGGAVAEALVRVGIGHLLLIDGDSVDETNINRQLIASLDTVGMDKTDAAKIRFDKINPNAEICYKKEFYLPENSDFLYEWKPDYIIDAIDTVTAKLDLAKKCNEKGIPLIMCLGTGNRLDPSKFHIGDIKDTAGCGCPLAKVMRHELKKMGIYSQKVLYSTEDPIKVSISGENGKNSPGSISFVPPVAGYIIASECVRNLISEK